MYCMYMFPIHLFLKDIFKKKPRVLETCHGNLNLAGSDILIMITAVSAISRLFS